MTKLSFVRQVTVAPFPFFFAQIFGQLPPTRSHRVNAPSLRSLHIPPMAISPPWNATLWKDCRQA